MKDDMSIIRIYPNEYPSLTEDQICSHIKNILNFNLKKEKDLPSEIEIILMYKHDKLLIENNKKVEDLRGLLDIERRKNKKMEKENENLYHEIGILKSAIDILKE